MNPTHLLPEAEKFTLLNLCSLIEISFMKLNDIKTIVVISFFLLSIQGSEKDRVPQKGSHGRVPTESLLERPDQKVILSLLILSVT